MTEFLPFEHPASTRVPTARAPLDEPQRASLDYLIAHFNAPDFQLGSSLASLGPTALTDVERCYWSTEQFLRVLRATKWNRKDALKRALETANWRREFGVEELTADAIEKEALSGKEIVLGFDNEQRPVLYLHPNRQNTPPSHKHIEFVVWCLERTIDLLPATNPAIDTICLCIDLKSSRDDGGKAPPIAIGEARQVLHVLQTFYCERLGRAVCVRVPSLFWLFFKLISPLVDPVTKEKIRFNEDARKFVPPEQLQKLCFGGDYDYEYNHEVYFPALVKLCAERKAANLERWRKYGEGKCGLSETVIRGAVVPAGAEE